MFAIMEVALNRGPLNVPCGCIQATVMKTITFNLASLCQLRDDIIGLHN